MSKADNLRRLFAPRSIVLIGGANLAEPIHNTRAIGFDGELWVVNPKYEEIAGVRCYPSVADLPGAPDAAFVAVRAEMTIDVVAALAAKGCGGVVCYAAGFAEIGGAGEQLQTQLVAAAGEMALVGPNCYGLLNFSKGVALWPDRLSGSKHDKGVAIISQSGNLALNLTMQDRSVPINHMISVGNQAVLGVGDYIEPLLEDASVAAIGLYIEGLKDIAGFSRAALKALHKGVPLVVLKAGTSELGTQLTLSHTSSLAGADDIYQAMFDRLGILRVHSQSELLETLKLAALCKAPPSGRVGVLTCSGADSALVADGLDQAGLSLPPLSESQRASLRPLLPSFVTLSNPLDYNTAIWGDIEACTQVFGAMMDGASDTHILVLDFPKPGVGSDKEWQVAVDAMIGAHRGRNKTSIVLSNLSELLPEDARQRMLAAGIAPMQGLNEGMAALAALVKYGQRRAEVAALADSRCLELPAAQTVGGESHLLDEWRSKQLLSRYGLPVPAGRLVSLENVAAIAGEVGFPVVMKAVSDRLAHKTEAGAVALNLTQGAEVQACAEDMARRLAEQGLTEISFLIEPMICDSVAELIIGLKRDTQFGLALIVGTGGILVNLMNDSATLLLPTTRQDVTQALHGLKGHPLLTGYRGRPEGDLDAVVDAVMAVADFAIAHWDLVTELDINPLLVRPKGLGAVAVDALVRLG